MKQIVTMRLDKNIVDYFKALAHENEIRYQTLINLYLADCVKMKRGPSIQWKTEQSADGGVSLIREIAG